MLRRQLELIESDAGYANGSNGDTRHDRTRRVLGLAVRLYGGPRGLRYPRGYRDSSYLSILGTMIRRLSETDPLWRAGEVPRLEIRQAVRTWLSLLDSAFMETAVAFDLARSPRERWKAGRAAEAIQGFFPWVVRNARAVLVDELQKIWVLSLPLPLVVEDEDWQAESARLTSWISMDLERRPQPTEWVTKRTLELLFGARLPGAEPQPNGQPADSSASVVTTEQRQFWHDPTFRLIYWCGEEFRLTGKQAEVVKRVWPAVRGGRSRAAIQDDDLGSFSAWPKGTVCPKRRKEEVQDDHETEPFKLAKIFDRKTTGRPFYDRGYIQQDDGYVFLVPELPQER